jgi:hypothetical protein
VADRVGEERIFAASDELGASLDEAWEAGQRLTAWKRNTVGDPDPGSD